MQINEKIWVGVIGVFLTVTITEATTFEINYENTQHHSANISTRSVHCKDTDSGLSANFVRLLISSVHNNNGAINTGNIHDLENFCLDAGYTFPSIHNDLDNWCVFNSGKFGKKAKIGIGLNYNKTSSSWGWSDQSLLNYSRIWPPGWAPSDSSDEWCARIGTSLYWTPVRCDSSSNYNDLDYVICSSPNTIETTKAAETTVGPNVTVTPAPTTTEVVPTQQPGASFQNASRSETETDEKKSVVIIAVVTIVVLVIAVALYKNKNKTNEETEIIVEQHNSKGDPHYDEIGDSSPGVSSPAYVYDPIKLDASAFGSAQIAHYDLAQGEREETYKIVQRQIGTLDSHGYMVPANAEQIYDQADGSYDQASDDEALYDVADNENEEHTGVTYSVPTKKNKNTNNPETRNQDDFNV